MSVPRSQNIRRRVVGNNVWLGHDSAGTNERLAQAAVHKIEPDVQPTEVAVGRAMWAEIEAAAKAKQGDLVILLLGGRGAQALHRLVGERRVPAKLMNYSNVFTFLPKTPWRRWPWITDLVSCATLSDCLVQAFLPRSRALLR